MKRSVTQLMVLGFLIVVVYNVSYTQSPSSPCSEQFLDAIHQAQNAVVSIHVHGTSQGEQWDRIGSGFVYHSKGLIVTHQRVIQGGDEIKVILRSGKQIRAWFVHSDTETGVALLQTMKPLKNELILNQPSSLKENSPIYLLGNSLGVFPSLAQGLLLKKRKNGFLLDIQAPPGNCGGPVFNDQGKVIGILAGHTKNMSLFSNRKNNRIVIPIDKIHQIVTLISSRFSDDKGWIGITVVDIPYSHSGVRVVDIVPKGPADKAHICKGDTIVTFNNEPIVYAKDLALKISQTEPGDKIQFTIHRDGQSKIRTIHVRNVPWKYLHQVSKVP